MQYQDDNLVSSKIDELFKNENYLVLIPIKNQIFMLIISNYKKIKRLDIVIR